MQKKELVSNRQKVRHIKETEAERMYEDDTFVVVHPLTEAASCVYGKGTQWCTAAANCYNSFNYYNGIGNLYIIINKKRGKKFQFHFETRSFMDETDQYINPPIFDTLGATSGLVDFILQKFIELWEDREFDDHLAHEFFYDFFCGYDHAFDTAIECFEKALELDPELAKNVKYHKVYLNALLNKTLINEGVHPKDKQAFEYVKSHVKTPFSDEEFLIIEKFFAEYHDSLYPDGIMGDGDTKNFIYRNLEATEQFIPQHRVDAIADALYE
ncbi:hypothetical protein AGMMS49982_23620 [Bacteroidia bacterium]|nr:hypothetical protein AGMMS49982_23620 [Bacteroidia bacterium]